MRAKMVKLSGRVNLPMMGDWNELRSFGFVPRETEDIMVYDTKVPAGWHEEGPDRQANKYLVDPRGLRTFEVVTLRQPAIFRCNVGRGLAERLVDSSEEPSLSPQWDALSAEERAEFHRRIGELSRTLLEKAQRAERLLQLAEARTASKDFAAPQGKEERDDG